MPAAEVIDEAPTPNGELIALVDDSATARLVMKQWLEAAGYRTEEYPSGRSVIEHDGFAPSAVCLDLFLGDLSGIEVLQHLHGIDRDLPVILVTAQREIETAVQAMRAGAYDYLVKPIEKERLLQTVGRALKQRELAMTVHRLKGQLSESSMVRSILGQSPAMQELSRQMTRVVDSDVPVCLIGQSGTGKELVARAIHDGGKRKAGPFVAINCAAIPQSLQESELFGHEKGAFTGAVGTHRGRFEQANSGSLFLDELGEMTPATQASLLRTLQERTVRRVGGTTEIPVNVRILSATHRDLEVEMQAGRFRPDLYFRLVVYPIPLPPLKERIADIPLLVAHFLQKHRKTEPAITRISPDVLEAFARHGWPGNVRELENAVQRAILACDGDEIRVEHLPIALRDLMRPQLAVPAAGRGEPAAPKDADEVIPLRSVERRAIENAIRRTDGNIAKAAALLGIGRATLYRRLAHYGISSE